MPWRKLVIRDSGREQERWLRSCATRARSPSPDEYAAPHPDRTLARDLAAARLDEAPDPLVNKGPCGLVKNHEDKRMDRSMKVSRRCADRDSRHSTDLEAQLTEMARQYTDQDLRHKDIIAKCASQDSRLHELSQECSDQHMPFEEVVKQYVDQDLRLVKMLQDSKLNELLQQCSSQLLRFQEVVKQCGTSARGSMRSCRGVREKDSRLAVVSQRCAGHVLMKCFVGQDSQHKVVVSQYSNQDLRLEEGGAQCADQDSRHGEMSKRIADQVLRLQGMTKHHANQDVRLEQVVE